MKRIISVPSDGSVKFHLVQCFSAFYVHAHDQPDGEGLAARLIAKMKVRSRNHMELHTVIGINSWWYSTCTNMVYQSTVDI